MPITASRLIVKGGRLPYCENALVVKKNVSKRLNMIRILFIDEIFLRSVICVLAPEMAGKERFQIYRINL